MPVANHGGFFYWFDSRVRQGLLFLQTESFFAQEKGVAVDIRTLFRLASALAFICFCVAAVTSPAQATWKPEYAKENPKVIEWFKTAKLTPAAYKRLHYDNCCEKADRLMTKFVPPADKYGEDRWFYYADPNCTIKGCKLVLIPSDTIHYEGFPKAKDGEEDPFKQLKIEGVLFIYYGKVTCFWPPEENN